MNGKVVISCELNTKELEKDIKTSEKELQRYEKEAEELTKAKARAEIDLQPYEEAKQKLQQMKSEYQSLNEQALKVDTSTKEGLASYKEIHAKIGQISNNMSEYQQKVSEGNAGYTAAKQNLNEINKKIESNSNSQGMLNNRIGEMRAKLAKKEGLDNIKKSFGEINKNLKDTVKNVAKWALAILGVRSAYNAVRNAMSTISQYDDQLSGNLDYIKYALAYSIKPIIDTILNLVVKLLQYVNYIAKAWTGKDLFKGADAFDQARKNAKGLNKEVEKTTASFDEMNVLQAPSESGGGGDIGPSASFDLTGFQGEVPAWLQWIVDNKDIILAVIAGVTAGLLAWQLGLSGIQALGIGIAVAGIVLAIESLLAYIQDPSWENFGKIITGIGLAVAGVALAFGAWPVVIAGAIVAIVSIIVSNWDKIKEFFQNAIDWLKGKSDKVHEKFGDLLGGVYDSIVDIFQNVLDIFDNVFTTLKGVFDGIIQFVKGVFTGNWKQVWDGLVKIFSSVFNGLVGIVKNVLNIIWNLINTVALTVAQVVVELFKTVVNGVLKVIETVLNTPIKTINKLIGVINKVPGINLGTLPTFKLPRLAKGAVINQPGRGIPVGYGQAVAGEKGQEGVLPLTDSQQMQLLGEAIGRYVTINANITNTMNGRVISRELQKVNNTNDFAFNR